jgi:hypothetical protein
VLTELDAVITMPASLRQPAPLYRVCLSVLVALYLLWLISCSLCTGCAAV